MTDDFTELDVNAGYTYSMATPWNRECQASKRFGFTVENLGPMTVNGNWVSIPQRVDFTTLGDTYEGISVYEIEGDLIKQHFATVLGGAIERSAIEEPGPTSPGSRRRPAARIRLADPISLSDPLPERKGTPLLKGAVQGGQNTPP